MAFVRGFVRSYARLLQLDPNPLLAALPQPPAPASLFGVNADTEVRFPDAHASRKQNFIWLAAGLGVAVVLGLFIWMNDSPQQATQVETLSLPPVTAAPASEVPAVTSPSSVSPVPTSSGAAAPSKATPAPAAKAPPATMAPLVGPPVPPSVKGAGNIIKGTPQSDAANQGPPVRLVFEQDSWVEVSDKNGIYLMAQLNLSGTERRVRGTPPFHLTIGNASGVRLYYYGKAVDLAPFNKAGVAHLTLE